MLTILNFNFFKITQIHQNGHDKQWQNNWYGHVGCGRRYLSLGHNELIFCLTIGSRIIFKAWTLRLSVILVADSLPAAAKISAYICDKLTILAIVKRLTFALELIDWIIFYNICTDGIILARIGPTRANIMTATAARIKFFAKANKLKIFVHCTNSMVWTVREATGQIFFVQQKNRQSQM